MRIDESAGGVVISDNSAIALVMSTHSKSWLFPKGHIDSNETYEEAARREIMEETGIKDLDYLDNLGDFTRPRYTFNGKTIDERTIHMFLFMTPTHEALTPTMEIEEARWVPYREVSNVLGTPHTDWFSADRAWFTSVFPRVREAIQRD